MEKNLTINYFKNNKVYSIPRLNITTHAVDAYRVRVLEDKLRYRREDNEIRKIIGLAFRDNYVTLGIPKFLHQHSASVIFKDPYIKMETKPYYLIVKKDKENIGEYYCPTIKEIEIPQVLRINYNNA